MAKQVINVGTADFAGDGDALRTAFTKVNDNFTELYDDDAQDITLNSFSITSQPASGGGALTYSNATGVFTYTPPDIGTGFEIVDDTTPQLGGNLDMNGFEIVTTNSGHIRLDPDGTGGVGIGNVTNAATLLHLQQSAPVITLQRLDNALSQGISWTGQNGVQAASIMLDGTGGTTNTLILSAFDGSSVTERLRIMAASGKGIKVTGDIESDGVLKLITNQGNDNIQLETSGTGNILLKGDKVGIGIVNQPDTTLHLKDTNSVITLQRTADANTPGLSFQNSNGNVRAELKIDGINGTSNEVFIKTDNQDGNGLVERLRVGHTATTVTGDLVVSGDFTVNGTTTTVNTTEMTVSDNIITLNSDVTGAPSENAGIEVERGNSTNVNIRWNETSDNWEYTNDGTVYNNISSLSADPSPTLSSDLNVGGNSIVGGNSPINIAPGGTASINLSADETITTGKILYSNMYAQLADLPSATTYHGMFAHVHATGAAYFAHGGAWVQLANHADLGGGGSSNAISQGNTNVTVTDTGTNGTIIFDTDGTDRWAFTSAGHLLPYSNASYDIGSADYKVRHLFLSDNSLKFVDSSDVVYTLGVNGGTLEFNGSPVGGGGGGMANLVDDTSPQLGGTLDLNLQSITSQGNISIQTVVNPYAIDIGTSSVSGSAVNIGSQALSTPVNISGESNFGAHATFDRGVHERFYTITGATGTVTHNCWWGHLWYHTGVAANFTANITNLGLEQEDATNVAIVINQGNTGYIPNAIEIAGVAQTITWQGNSAPTPTDNGIDTFSFTILNRGGVYVVLGQMTAFGGV